ncbi:ABC transporter ATP-binding protein [Bacillus alkalicellulosilyticus]|uniref:ABC transporter ATP-binding protein n=1 Tax=Alkalihalobacterium alkalicellulosilyticum TaxID=1912214 RepID=UPI0009970299|nr:ABC transporter ATP-binding protein [Bacillus alkalicellulosilyticus]
MIYLENVSLVKSKKTIVNNVSWKVNKGEHWAILGLNGSGKTSILKLITGYEWATKGNVHVFGHRFGTVNIQELRKRIGWVSSSLDERFHSRPNDHAIDVILSGKFASIGLYEKIEQEDIDKAKELITLFSIEHVADEPFRLLSQGEKKKVMLARAWMSDPEILILDEPCSGLDLYSREQLLNTIEKLANTKTGPTILYVTHHIEEILPPFSNCLLMKGGKVFDSGLTKEMLTAKNVEGVFRTPVSLQWSKGRAWITVK